MSAPRIYLNGATIMTTPTDSHIEIARHTGYDGVEVRAERLLGDAEELARASRVVRPGEVWSLNGVRIAIAADGSLERALLERDLQPRLEICRVLGAQYLLVVPPRSAALTTDLAIPALRDGLALTRDAAARAGVGVAFEFLGFFDCPVRTPTEVARAVDGLDGVDLVLDSCHWHASGSEPLDAFPVERLAMVHLNDAPQKEPSRIEDGDRLLPGEGVIRLPSLISQLEARGYRGPFGVETFNPSHWAADPVEIAQRGRTAVRELLVTTGT